MQESDDQIAQEILLDTGNMRPDSSMLREFGLPVPIDFGQIGSRDLKLDSKQMKNSPLLSSHGDE